jgi:alpha-L-arabinofuranosidase
MNRTLLQLTVKLVNPQPRSQPLTIALEGIRSVSPKATVITLSADPGDTNSIDQPAKVASVTAQVTGIKSSFTHTIPPHSVSVLKLGTLVAR